LEGIHIPKAMEVHSNYGSGCDFGCDGKGPMGLVRCDPELISIAVDPKRGYGVN